MKAAWAAVGVEEIPDINSGSPLGLGEIVESRIDGSRLIASSAYRLQGVQILTGALAKRVLIKQANGKKTASGVELADGRTLFAKREVILSAGSHRTAQLLMLSGIGSATELRKHGIELVVDAPEVGKNLWDHLGTRQLWKLQHPEIGASFGSPQWNDPAYAKGNPVDWLAFHKVSKDGLGAALSRDHYREEDILSLVSTPRCHVGTFVQYAGVSPADPVVPMDGSHITTIVLVMLPTSRGSITLASTDPETPPIIDFNYYATEADRFRMREGVRRLVSMMCDTPEGKEMVESETVADGYGRLCLNSKDEEVDKRVRQAARQVYLDIFLSLAV